MNGLRTRQSFALRLRGGSNDVFGSRVEVQAEPKPLSILEGGVTEAYPLSWPVGVPRTRHPAQSAFGEVTIHRATQELLWEIERMGGRLPVVSTNLELRNDGLPYSKQRPIADHGVAVYFTRKGHQMVFACDRWNRIEHNMRAITKTIEAMRGIERWGSSDLMERAFAGFEALQIGRAHV